MKQRITQAEFQRLQAISTRARDIRAEQDELEYEVDDILEAHDEGETGMTERDDLLSDFILNGKLLQELLDELEIKVEGA